MPLDVDAITQSVAEAVASGNNQNPEWLEVEQFFERKDRHFARAYLEEQARYERFHEQTRQGIHACRVERAAGAHLSQQITGSLRKVQTACLENVQAHRKERHSVETSLERLVFEHTADVRGQHAEEQRESTSALTYTDQVRGEVCHLYNELEQTRNYRIKKSEQLQEVVQDKLSDIYVAIDAERRIREESTGTLLEVFSSMGERLQQQLNDVKRDRKDSSERLVHLMETVLPHLERARHGHIKAVEEKLEDQQAASELANDAACKFSRRQSMKRPTMVGAPPGVIVRKSIFGKNAVKKSLTNVIKEAGNAVSESVQAMFTPRKDKVHHFDDV